MRSLFPIACLLLVSLRPSHGFLNPSHRASHEARITSQIQQQHFAKSLLQSQKDDDLTLQSNLRRKIMLLPFLAPLPVFAEESIVERAARLSQEVTPNNPTSVATSGDSRTAYDFSLPVAGESIPITDIIRQEYSPEGEPKVKAFLVVNIKQDDPIARKNIPELIALASKYGKLGFSVICLPTDQGYYEPDTSAMIRLKLNAEYGYGANPTMALTDKINLLGTGAHPFIRWLQGACRNPSGLGRIQANFEKFLLDGNGRPLRRYPRKYDPVMLMTDIEATLQQKPLPPPQGNFYELWRGAASDEERDLYRFQKGLNYFDQ